MTTEENLDSKENCYTELPAMALDVILELRQWKAEIQVKCSKLWTNKQSGE